MSPQLGFIKWFKGKKCCLSYIVYWKGCYILQVPELDEVKYLHVLKLVEVEATDQGEMVSLSILWHKWHAKQTWACYKPKHSRFCMFHALLQHIWLSQQPGI